MTAYAQVMDLCSIEACPKNATARGWCHTHYMRWRRRGTVDLPVVTAVDRFRSHVQFGRPDECWEWTASRNPDGYGHFEHGRAHRFAFELEHGPIPAGMVVCHRCDNRSCVNPAHLFLGTHRDNMADMIAKRRHQHGTSHHSAKLTEEDVRVVLALRAEGWTQQRIAERFGISQSSVSLLCLGRTWTHVSP